MMMKHIITNFTHYLSHVISRCFCYPYIINNSYFLRFIKLMFFKTNNNIIHGISENPPIRILTTLF
nr:MAG TPA: hypothetical protein [Caudoviricetes sp.]